MGAKKKVEISVQPPPPAPQEKAVNNTYVIKTLEGSEFKLSE